VSHTPAGRSGPLADLLRSLSRAELEQLRDGALIEEAIASAGLASDEPPGPPASGYLVLLGPAGEPIGPPEAVRFTATYDAGGGVTIENATPVMLSRFPHAEAVRARAIGVFDDDGNQIADTPVLGPDGRVRVPVDVESGAYTAREPRR